MIDLLSVLRNAGLRVVEEGDWRHRGRPASSGPFGPVHGIVNHHTGSSVPVIPILINGRSDLPGPLCHMNLDRDGVIHLIAGGRANHAGKGSGSVLENVKAGRPPGPTGPDDTDGNSVYWGVEVDNNGGGEPYTPAQINALIRLNAAICEAEGWNENHCIHHKEHTKRKVDMSWTGDLRHLVGEALRGSLAPQSSGQSKEEVMALIPNAVTAVTCPTGGGWILASDGGVATYGGAPFLGSCNKQGWHCIAMELIEARKGLRKVYGYRIISDNGNHKAFLPK